MINESVMIFVVVLLSVVNIGLLVFVLARQKKQPETDTSSMHLLNQNMQGIQQRLDSVATGMNQRLDKAAHVISEVTKELGSMQEIGRNMQGLQEFLRSPKLRGNIGEKVLEQMLQQHFPQMLYQMQYKFRDGQIVDAIIRTDKGIIPVDSKFPMENYMRMTKAETDAVRDSATNDFLRDVKKHVNDIAKKYILPAEHTLDFALMYVPSESVYYEIMRHDVALQLHGIEKKVLFVSPNSLFYFLQVILAGLKEKEVAEAAREIIGAIKGIQVDSKKFAEQLGILERHLTNAQNAIVKSKTEFDKLADKIVRIDSIEQKVVSVVNDDTLSPTTPIPPL